MKKTLTFLSALFALHANAQQEKSVQFSQKGLYDDIIATDSNYIGNFQAVYIYQDAIDNSVWVSPEKQCVQITTETKEVKQGSQSIHVTWDKVSGGCTWIGLGFGWNAWMGKDLNEVVNNASIQFFVKSVKGNFKNLPVAFGIEDYAGAQAYVGYADSLSQGLFTDKQWQVVTIPLKLFPFERYEVNTGNIKQFIIQLEGDGDIYLDDIKIIPNEN